MKGEVIIGPGAGLRYLAVSLAAASFKVEAVEQRQEPPTLDIEYKMYAKPEEFRFREAPRSKFIPSKESQPWKRNRRK